MNRGGSALSMATNGIHGHPGTIARPVSRSMASTILRTPVSLSTISMVDSDFAVISDSMYPGSITVTLIGPEAYSARSDSPSDDTPALLAA